MGGLTNKKMIHTWNSLYTYHYYGSVPGRTNTGANVIEYRTINIEE